VATPELQLINSVLKNKDIGIIYKENVDDLFSAYTDVWEGIKDYHARYGAVPDIEIMQDKYEIEEVPVAGESAYYLETLKNEVIHNRMKALVEKASIKLRPDTAEIVLNGLQNDLSKLNKFSHSARDLNIMDFEAAEKHYEEIRAKAEAMGGVPGIPTGISFIDSAYTSGLAGGDLVVLLGWTGRGKSQFAGLLMCNAFLLGHKPMYISLEMTEEKMRDRVYTILGNGTFRHSDLSLGIINDDDFRTFKANYADGRDFIIVTNDGIAELTPNVIQGKIDQHKPSALVFDYAQLASDNENSSDMTARMRNMSKQFKRLAVRNDIPVILISSATPDSSASASTPPIIEQVAWSKQLAFDADLAIAVHKHDDSDLIEIVCRKNRNGELFAGFLDWDINRGILKESFGPEDND
jgi:replicative DNA helicase